MGAWRLSTLAVVGCCLLLAGSRPVAAYPGSLCCNDPLMELGAQIMGAAVSLQPPGSGVGLEFDPPQYAPGIPLVVSAGEWPTGDFIAIGATDSNGDEIGVFSDLDSDFLATCDSQVFMPNQFEPPTTFRATFTPPTSAVGDLTFKLMWSNGMFGYVYILEKQLAPAAATTPRVAAATAANSSRPAA